MTRKLTVKERIKRKVRAIWIEHICDAVLVLIGKKHGATKPKRTKKEKAPENQESLPGCEVHLNKGVKSS